MSLVVANGLAHRFGNELALMGVDLVLDTGEHMAVLGDNGRHRMQDAQSTQDSSGGHTGVQRSRD